MEEWGKKMIIRFQYMCFNFNFPPIFPKTMRGYSEKHTPLETVNRMNFSKLAEQLIMNTIFFAGLLGFVVLLRQLGIEIKKIH